MKRDSFTNALRATAKVACAASLLHMGCRNKIPAEVATPSNTDSSEESNDSSSIGEHDTNTTRDPTEAEYLECQPIIAEAFVGGAFPDETTSQEVKDCCALTATYYDALSAETGDFNITMEWEYRNECCSAIEWRGGTMACTPWGPPTPPSARKMKYRNIVHQNRILV